MADKHDYFSLIFFLNNLFQQHAIQAFGFFLFIHIKDSFQKDQKGFFPEIKYHMDIQIMLYRDVTSEPSEPFSDRLR